MLEEGGRAFSYRSQLPGGPGDLTLAELQEMAARQQHQMEAQQQVLVAKEQRLKYLKQQEARHAQLASESERLKRIRERVESQELKLKKLRALRGQAEHYRASNSNLNSELDSVKAVFNEKEKELAMAVAKVEQLTRQLKELRNGAVNAMLSDKKQSAAAVELERLRKELLIRNKLNEEQNNAIATKENVLREQKEKVASMDNRIHELRQRLKKRKLQEDQNNQSLKQSDKSNAKQNKGENQTEFRGNEKKGMFGADPYIQYAPQDVAKDDSYTGSGGFTKHDPKYQTLPSNVKLTQSSKPTAKTAASRSQSNEMNNNNDGVEEYRLPTVLPMNPNAFAPVNNNSQRLPIQQPSKTPRFNNNDLSKPNQNFVPQPMGRQSQEDKSNVSAYRNASKPSFPVNHSNDPPDRRKMQGMDPLPGRNGHVISSSPHPVISINEEERQAGSGQSSPASSEGSNSSGGIQIKGDNGGESVNTASIGSVTAMIEKLNKGKSSSQAAMEDDYGANMLSQFGANRGSDKGRFSKMGPGHQDLQSTSFSKQSLHPQQHGGSQAVNSSSSTHQDNGLSQFQELPSDSPDFRGPPISSSHGNQPNVSHPTTQSPHLNLKPAPTYRYASKNQIANTYMGRLGGVAMERYQQNLNKLYTNLEHEQKEAKAKSGESSLDAAAKGNQVSVNDTEAPASAGQEQFGSVSPHDYPDIASDKGSYKLNTPKQVRRRHSDSENEDLNKALQEHQNYDQQVGAEDTKTSSANDVINLNGRSTHPPLPPSNSKNDEKINKQPSVEEKGTASDSAPSNKKEKRDTDKSASTPKSKVEVVRRTKSNLKKENARRSNNRVSFDPLALLLDASLEGELDLVKKVAIQVEDVSTPNDEGITALHNAICAGHFEIVKFLIEFGCDVNSPDSDGWTPLHCAASCNNLPMVRFLVEHGACVFATTISDQETAADKCEEDEDGYDGCSEYLYSTQEKLGIINNGDVYSVFDYTASNKDELNFVIGDRIAVLRKGDESEKEWWWAKLKEKEGYIPRNLLGLYPRVIQQPSEVSDC